MTPTVQEIVEQIVGSHRQYGCYSPQTEKTELTDCGVLKGRGICTCGIDLEIRKIVNAMTTFAQARERAVWEEAASLMIPSAGSLHMVRSVDFFNNLYQEFRRRATQAYIVDPKLGQQV